MSKNKSNYSQNTYPQGKLSVVLDFSKRDIINHPSNSNIDGEIKAELISFERVDKTVRPYKSKIQLGSYISKDHLQKILKKERSGRSLYCVLENIRKRDIATAALSKDFDLLRDFFPAALVLEVEDYCLRMMPKVEKNVEKEGAKRITPRKRRAFVLAVFRSVCRKNGRAITEELMHEINLRFGYKRMMKLFEVFQAENELINWKLLAKKVNTKQNNLKTFFLNAMNQFNRLKEEPKIKENSEFIEILSLTKKHILGYASRKDCHQAIIEITRHKDADFATRLIIWSIAKHFAQEKYELAFKNPEDLGGWKTLFLIDCGLNSEEIPIRSFKYIFWSEFSLRKDLKESNLFPETESQEEEATS